MFSHDGHLLFLLLLVTVLLLAIPATSEGGSTYISIVDDIFMQKVWTNFMPKFFAGGIFTLEMSMFVSQRLSAPHVRLLDAPPDSNEAGRHRKQKR